MVSTLSTEVHLPVVEVLPLGGVGEFGMNAMLISAEETTVMIDAGVMFPGPDHPGVDLIIPDFSHLNGNGRQVSAIVLTHGHEDHIGAVPYFWPLLQGPVYGTPLTLALLKAKLDEHKIDSTDRLISTTAGQKIAVGPLEVEFIRVTHSMPDCVALAIHTSVGTIVHTGDFKIDETPQDGEHVDTNRLAQLGRTGVLALLSDSTNAKEPGNAGSELDVIEDFEELFTDTVGKLLVATFSSSLHRIQVLMNLANRFQRKVALVGRAIQKNTEIAERLGRLTIPHNIQIDEQEVANHPAREVLCITTGSQGQPLAALSRIAVDTHRYISLGPEDTVVFSARVIPGNHQAISRLMNNIARRGARVIDNQTKHVHVSGHAYREELKLMLSLLKPRYFVPIHGEYPYLAQHAQIAKEVTGGDTTVLLVENGHTLAFDAVKGWIHEVVAAGQLLIDNTREGTVTKDTLQERQQMSAHGVLALLITIDPHKNKSEPDTSVVTRGFVLDRASSSLLDEIPKIVQKIFQAETQDGRISRDVLGERIRIELQRFLRKHSGRRPLVMPLIMEI